MTNSVLERRVLSFMEILVLYQKSLRNHLAVKTYPCKCASSCGILNDSRIREKRGRESLQIRISEILYNSFNSTSTLAHVIRKEEVGGLGMELVAAFWVEVNCMQMLLLDCFSSGAFWPDPDHFQTWLFFCSLLPLNQIWSHSVLFPGILFPLK